MPEMIKLMEDINVDKEVGHMCRCGMKSKDEQGVGLVTKPKAFPSKSPFVKEQLERKCTGGHSHAALMGVSGQSMSD